MSSDRIVKIAHLSDLHFGALGDKAAWNCLLEYLCNEVKPDLVLVTGDLVDTPKRPLFAEAREALENLNEKLGWIKGDPKKYIVCAGNHDRHARGNALPWRWAKNYFEAAPFEPPTLNEPYI